MPPMIEYDGWKVQSKGEMKDLGLEGEGEGWVEFEVKTGGGGFGEEIERVFGREAMKLFTVSKNENPTLLLKKVIK